VNKGISYKGLEENTEFFKATEIHWIGIALSQQRSAKNSAHWREH